MREAKTIILETSNSGEEVNIGLYPDHTEMINLTELFDCMVRVVLSEDRPAHILVEKAEYIDGKETGYSSIIIEFTDKGVPLIRTGPNGTVAPAVEIDQEIADTQNITVLTKKGERLDFVDDYLG